VTAEFGRIARYALVGLSNTVLTFVAYTLLVGLGVAAPAASAAGFAVGAFNGYHLNRRWTFGAARGRALRYVVVQGVGAAASAAGVALARSDGVARLTSELIVIPVVTLMTYVLVRAAVVVPAR
jgi:putative flippase GtrA